MRRLPALGFALLAAGCTPSLPSPPPPAPAPAPSSAPAPRSLTLGAWHGCVRLDDGRVRCWGSNDRDQLGDGYIPFRATPVVAPVVPDTVELRLGGYSTCARTGDGRVQCWGGGHAAPAPVPGLDDAVELTADIFRACARRRSGRVTCWNQRPLEGTTPVDVPEIHDAVGFVSPQCFVRRSGAVTCVDWERPPGDASRLPPTVTTSVVRWAAVDALRARARRVVGSCALDDHEGVACWDLASARRVGGKMPLVAPAPRADLGPVLDLVSGQRHTCALQRSGRVLCWGDNDHGQLGDGTTETHRDDPVPVAGLADATAIAAGVNHTCALRAGGIVGCWGANDSGQLGDGTTVDRLAPATVTGLGPALEVAAGGAHTCARRRDGALACWGAGVAGQLGDATAMHVDHGAPVTVAGLPPAAGIAAGASHTCALGRDGRVACWGAISDGPAPCVPVEGGGMECSGYGTSCGKIWDGHTEAHATPEIVADVTQVLALRAHGDRTCALQADGAIRCWARPHRCSVSGAVEARPTTLPVAGADEIAMSAGFACARRGGAVLCGGSNRAGQLGDGTTVDRPTFAPVPGLDDAAALALGDRHACALRRGGAVACWGFNVSGQLGDGTRAGKGAPTRVVGLDDAVEVAAGRWHTCARRRAGSVVCWGENDARSLGDGTTEDRLAPVAVPGIDDAVEIAAATDSTCARRRAGRVTCWGPLAGEGARGPTDVAGAEAAAPPGP
jgi:alpha-tubulin suppressor-like RCC1 family protein